MPAADPSETPPDGLTVAIELAQIASGPGSTQQRACDLLVALGRLIPFAWATVQVLDPECRQLRSLVSTGPRAVGSDRPGNDVGVCLVTPDGRRVGLLTVHTGTTRGLTDRAQHLLQALVPVLTAVVDPMRAVLMLAATVADATAGVVLTRTGSTLPVPGLPAHQLLGAGCPVLATVDHELSGGRGRTTFLSPYGSEHEPDGHARITALACPEEPSSVLAAVVVVGPPGELCGLTARELEILGLIVEGCQNSQMADALFITERTVAAHVEHVLAKLGTATRTRAAVRALRQGLYVPRFLARPSSATAG
jgi:DNA-binding CsgD family transcriptional regulator